MASEMGHRLFRNNIGVGWVGKSIRYTENRTIKVQPGDVLIRQARPLHAGLIEGSSDTVGFSKDGRFIAIETKTLNGVTHPERLRKQFNFIKQINDAGGIAGMVRTEEDAFELFI